MLMAHCLVMALEAAGKVVYPNTSTFWHYDDKLAQKYLLEATGAPLFGDSRVFDAKTAIDWIERTAFPKCLSCVGVQAHPMSVLCAVLRKQRGQSG